MARTRVRRRGSIASAAIFALLAAATLPIPAAASSPCPPFSYSVTYTSPSWTISVDHAPAAPLDATWYWAPWNGSYESFLGHTGRPATQLERVTLDDRDGDGTLSASDQVQVWDGPQSLRNLTVAWYGNASRVGFSQYVQLTDGVRSGCTGGPPVWADPLVLLGVALGVTGVVLGVFLSRRRR